MKATKQKAFAQDGAVLIEGFLNAEQFARCRAVYDSCGVNPGRVPYLPLVSAARSGQEAGRILENSACILP